MTLAIYALAGGVIGILYSQVVGGQAIFGFSTGVAIVGGVFAFELLFVQQPAGAWLRGLPLLAFTTISTLVWTAIIAASLQVVPRLLGETEAYGESYQASTFQQDLVFALIVAFAMNAMLRIRSLVGGRVLTNFLLGRYHRPLREQRVFLFLDLADSTYLSEKLGDIRIQTLIGRFFFDIAQPIAEHGGETHRYIGDEIVVTWPLAEAVKDARCLECVFKIQEFIAARSRDYESDYGLVPRFRAGMHGGTVVASEIGDDKREIVYFGDTINTAARLQALCKEKKTTFLVSGKLLDMMNLPHGVKAENIGEVKLRGKARAMEVFALSRQKRD